MHARQMGGKRAALGPALFRAGASALLILLVVGGLARGDGLLDILERQGELVRIELLRPTAELHALQLTQEMLQAIDLRQRLVALGERGRQPRLQLGDFVSLTPRKKRDLRVVVTRQMQAESIGRSFTTQLPGAACHARVEATSPARRRARRAAKPTDASRRR